MGRLRSGFAPAGRERTASPNPASVDDGGCPEEQPTTTARAAQSNQSNSVIGQLRLWWLLSDDLLKLRCGP